MISNELKKRISLEQELKVGRIANIYHFNSCKLDPTDRKLTFFHSEAQVPVADGSKNIFIYPSTNQIIYLYDTSIHIAAGFLQPISLSLYIYIHIYISLSIFSFLAVCLELPPRMFKVYVASRCPDGSFSQPPFETRRRCISVQTRVVSDQALEEKKHSEQQKLGEKSPNNGNICSFQLLFKNNIKTHGLA